MHRATSWSPTHDLGHTRSSPRCTHLPADVDAGTSTLPQLQQPQLLSFEVPEMTEQLSCFVAASFKVTSAMAHDVQSASG
jgi:hypothetical protein